MATTHISRNCSEGKHHRCLGTVYDMSDGVTALVPCECPDGACAHAQAGLATAAAD